MSAQETFGRDRGVLASDDEPAGSHASVGLSLRSVTKNFSTRGSQRIDAVSDLSLDVRPEEFVSLVGPSGCGKSTLLGMIAGLLPTTSGEIRMDDTPVAGPSPDRGVVFQESSVLPWLRAIDNVTFGLEIQSQGTKAQRRDLAEHYLELVGLKDFSGYYPKEMSGGMRQRLAIAQTLVCRPQVLLMDEPFGALDAFTRDVLQIALLDIWESERKTVVFVTHSVDEAVFLSDRIVVMGTNPGRILEIVDVPLARPRSSDVRGEPEFGDTRRHVWGLITDAQGAIDTASSKTREPA